MRHPDRLIPYEARKSLSLLVAAALLSVAAGMPSSARAQDEEGKTVDCAAFSRSNNLRKRPEMGSPILRQTDPGETLQINLLRSEGGKTWGRLSDGTGWIALENSFGTEYVQSNSPCLSVAEGVPQATVQNPDASAQVEVAGQPRVIELPSYHATPVLPGADGYPSIAHDNKTVYSIQSAEIPNADPILLAGTMFEAGGPTGVFAPILNAQIGDVIHDPNFGNCRVIWIQENDTTLQWSHQEGITMVTYGTSINYIGKMKKFVICKVE